MALSQASRRFAVKFSMALGSEKNCVEPPSTKFELQEETQHLIIKLFSIVRQA